MADSPHSTSNAELDQEAASPPLAAAAKREPKAPVRYIGPKETKTDNLYGTGAVWHGPGDIQQVPVSAVRKLLSHPRIWAHPDEPWEPPKAKVKPQVLADLVLAGDWASIASVAPGAFDKAEKFFRARCDTGAEPEAEPPHGEPPHARTAEREDIQAWAARMVDGAAKDVEERLREDLGWIGDPGLIEALGEAERAGRNRRGVLNLIAEAAQSQLDGQADLLSGAGASSEA